MGGIPHHVLNRAVRRSVIFGADEDYRTFEDVLIDARSRFSMRVCEYTVMPNHFHLILWPVTDLQVSDFMRWLTMTQTQRWHRARGTTGTGPLYQGRFKAFPVQTDHHFGTVARYVQRNPVRASLVRRVEDWRWSSAWRRCNNCDQWLADWPVAMPVDWVALANDPANDQDLVVVRDSVAASWPYGDAQWTRDMAERFAENRELRLRARKEKLALEYLVR